MAGITESVSTSVEHNPPSTTVASGRCMSEPMPVAQRRGSHAQHRHHDQDQALPELDSRALHHGLLQGQTFLASLFVHLRDV